MAFVANDLSGIASPPLSLPGSMPGDVMDMLFSFETPSFCRRRASADPSEIETNQQIDAVLLDRQTGSKTGRRRLTAVSRATPSFRQLTSGAFSSCERFRSQRFR